jgi:uncharacterized protein
MRDDRFEWDDAKADANVRKHGVTFEDARRVFDDPNALMESDDGTDEARDLTIGVSSGNVLFVVSTERGDRIRIISARRATRHEQDHYYRQAHS